MGRGVNKVGGDSEREGHGDAAFFLPDASPPSTKPQSWAQRSGRLKASLDEAVGQEGEAEGGEKAEGTEVDVGS